MTTARPQTTDELFPSPYVKSDDIDSNDLILTISRFNFELLGHDEKAEQKGCLYFDETEKKLVLNVTNCKTIEGMYGKRFDDWIGKQIALFKMEVQVGGEMKMGVRVRPNPPG